MHIRGLLFALHQLILISHGASAEHRFQGVFMTRNNLRDQLTWLLANVVLTAPNAPNLPKARDQLTSDPTSSSHRPTSSRPETRTEQFRKPPLYPILPDTSLHSEPTNGPAESAKSVRAPGGDTIGGRMGRPTSKSASNDLRFFFVRSNCSLQLPQAEVRGHLRENILRC